MAIDSCFDSDDRTDSEKLKASIENLQGAIAKKQAYLDFLQANPLFEQYMKLKREAD